MVLGCGSLYAQHSRDTLALRSSFKASQLVAPAVLGVAGAGVHYLGHQAIEIPLRESLQGSPIAGNVLSTASSVAQYVPVAMHLGLGLAGVPSQHSFLDRSIEAATGYGFCLGVGFILKKLFRSERPGGGAFNSFPSGHAAKAFTGAELLRMDYGWGWGGGAYALAGLVCAERVVDDRHWLGDVIAGAGLGILSAHVGGWLLEPVKSLFGIPDLDWDGLSGRRVRLAFIPGADPLSGSPTAGLSVLF